MSQATATAAVIALLYVESFQWVKKALHADGCYAFPEDAAGAAYTVSSLSIQQALDKLNEDGLAQKALDESWQLMRLKTVPTYLPKKAIKASMPAPPPVVEAPVDAAASAADVLPEPPAEVNVDVSDVVAGDPASADKSWIHDDGDDNIVYEPEVKAAAGE